MSLILRDRVEMLLTESRANSLPTVTSIAFTVIKLGRYEKSMKMVHTTD